MRNDVTPVAARNDAADPKSDANLRVAVSGSTKRFHLWQQGPAWILGFASVGLGFLMVLTNYDSSGGWFAVSVGIILSVVASFRSPFSFGESAVSTAPSRPQRKAPAKPSA